MQLDRSFPKEPFTTDVSGVWYIQSLDRINEVRTLVHEGFPVLEIAIPSPSQSSNQWSIANGSITP